MPSHRLVATGTGRIPASASATGTGTEIGAETARIDHESTGAGIGSTSATVMTSATGGKRGAEGIDGRETEMTGTVMGTIMGAGETLIRTAGARRGATEGRVRSRIGPS